MLKPVLQDEALLADIQAARRAPDSLHLWWLGQSGFLIQWQQHYALLDPYLSDSLTRKYASTDKPHVRLTERVIAPGHLSFVDVITSSHNHTDHLDAETLGPILQRNPKASLLVPAANRDFAADRLQISPTSLHTLDAGQSTNLGGFRFHALPAAHNTLERDAEGRYKFLGYIVEAGPWKIYHSGDTLLYEGLENRLRTAGIHIALLPINGDKPERRVAGNLDGRQAANLAHAIGAHLVIPCHFDLFAFNTASPADFISECQRLGQPHRVLRNGERWSSPAPPA